MYNYTFTDNNNKTWSRIDKRRARGLYNKGISIVVIPDNLKPFSDFAFEVYLNKEVDTISGLETDFNKRVNAFEIYNCINCETGYHAAFYMEVKKND
ncbi:MAG: hypothetical protein II669_04580 [Elusimicrobia bacterium]|nr:hypothetical protein [Elusimicrobiota bacterium]